MSAPLSWTNATSPTSATTGSPVASARPRAVDTTPSIPLAPRLAWAAARRPPNHSRSRIGIDAATTMSARPWALAGDEAGDGRFARATPSIGRLDRVLGELVGVRPAPRPCGVAHPVESGADRRECVDRDVGGDRMVGIDDAGAADLHDRAPPIRRSTGASTFDVDGRPTRTTTSGGSRGERRVAQQGVVRGHDDGL